MTAATIASTTGISTRSVHTALTEHFKESNLLSRAKTAAQRSVTDWS